MYTGPQWLNFKLPSCCIACLMLQPSTHVKKQSTGNTYILVKCSLQIDLYHGEGWMSCTYFVWVLAPLLLGVFWCQRLQLGGEKNELFVQVDAKNGEKIDDLQ